VPDVSPELPSHAWRVALSVLQRLPQAALSRSFGQLADLRIPPRLRPMVLSSFARAVGIDVAEAEKPIHEYESINDFFVRRLRAGVRSWPIEPERVTSPVDGVLGRGGRIADGRIIQAKGRTYTAAALLDDASLAARFDGGSFLTIYLSPRHYHRIHAPAGGSIGEARHVPGALLPVNAAAVMHVDDLFARNERVVCMQDTPAGGLAVVAIGAYNVGGISTAFDPSWLAPDGRSVTNRGAAKPERRVYEPPRRVARGDEIMAFHLGSTIVLLFESGIALHEALPAGGEIRLGEPIAAPR
jgi:phosphatidylserine decarboxylase